MSKPVKFQELGDLFFARGDDVRVTTSPLWEDESDMLEWMMNLSNADFKKVVFICYLVQTGFWGLKQEVGS